MLYNNRKVILIASCAFPAIVLVSKIVVEIAFMSFFILGALTFTAFTLIDSWNKAVDIQIKEAREKNLPIPIKNPKIAICMNIINKIAAFTFPWCVGSGATLELITMTSTPIGLCLGIGSAMLLSGGFYSANVFERNYEFS